MNEVNLAIRRGQGLIWSKQKDDGHWEESASLDPVCSAQVLIALWYAGALPEKAADIALWLCQRQRGDGSFPAYPFAQKGDLSATATVWAALHVAPATPKTEQAIARARRFVEENGGLPAVAAELYHADPAPVFVAMAGLMHPGQLPIAPLGMAVALSLAAPFLRHRFNFYVVMGLMMVLAILRDLQSERGSSGEARGVFARLERERILSFIEPCQNPGGDWNGESTQTALLLCAYHALGLPREDPRVARAIQWIERQRVETSSGSWYSVFSDGVWATAHAVRALLASGASRKDPRIQRAIEWLLAAQSEQAEPLIHSARAGAPRRGGVAFQRANVNMPDCDDTGVVLGALGLALAGSGADALEAGLAERVKRGVQRGVDWLSGMQDASGGWAAFARGFDEPPAGPIMTEVPKLPDGRLRSLIGFVAEPPWFFQDPANADITGRVVYGLAQNGYGREDPVVKKAIAFLQRQQCTSARGEGHGFWGRWIANYLAATSFVLQGLAVAGEDMQAPWVERAVKWVIERQNQDGGWGEDVTSYARPDLAGIGPSMPPLTGLVLSGLIAAGKADSPAVARGIRYLLDQQRADGTWPNGTWLHVYFPPNVFYYLPSDGWVYPLEALGLYASAIGDMMPVSLPFPSVREGEAIDVKPLPRLRSGRWNPAYLEAMRRVGDPVADDVVQQIFEEDGIAAVNDLLTAILRNDDPIPPGMPPKALAYFEETAALPAWADRGKIALAQRLFTRFGWSTAVGLYYCSLPTTYCAAKGARVLVGTGKLTDHATQRVAETAQFVFDVMDEGGLEPGGRGIRTAQKIRLLHAAIRHLTLKRQDWDLAYGLPINQEDIAATVMAFSWSTLCTFRHLRLQTSPAEREAWMHAWNVVGHLLGLDASLMPHGEVDGGALSHAIAARQWAPSDEGRALARALVEAVQKVLPRHLAGYAPTMIRYLAGDECADMLGLPPADWTRVLIEGEVHLGAVVENDLPAPFGHVLDNVSRAMMHGLALAAREGKRAQFRIPPKLMREWDLEGSMAA